MKLFPWIAALVLLVACAPVTVVPAADSGLRPDARGLAVAGSSQRIDFGRSADGVIAAVARLQGAPVSDVVNSECGAGPTRIVKFPGVDLLFAGGAFRGWVTGDPATQAGNGLSPGVTRAQLQSGGYGPFRATTLGVEFESDGIFGLLPDGGADTPIDVLWAGTSCFFR